MGRIKKEKEEEKRMMTTKRKKEKQHHNTTTTATITASNSRRTAHTNATACRTKCRGWGDTVVNFARNVLQNSDRSIILIA